ncbi:hypothetical protein OS190_01105 [Sulfitobacter sp. F26204]|uniref:protein-tyrosine phosphatase family protein n=1 Tax=Sulfitobacter sp. F26204 TaxID=2996014 RepID=UPI00225E6A4C|nr:protein-tyrosine phosphatase family protein [Sulfitobacter sp. F26204]MCX7558146.1 hypothetical protein [Sulfitobacter sp. F26204]
MTLRCYPVPVAAPGALWIMPCPPREDVMQAMRHLKEMGVSTVLSMLPEPEACDLGLQSEADLCAAHDMQFVSYPIVDFGLPDPEDFLGLITEIAAQLKGGGTVAIHCRAGIGRSGMVAACTLMALGDAAGSAVEKVSAARSVSVPDTVEQGKFITDFAKMMNKGNSSRH